MPIFCHLWCSLHSFCYGRQRGLSDCYRIRKWTWRGKFQFWMRLLTRKIVKYQGRQLSSLLKITGRQELKQSAGVAKADQNYDQLLSNNLRLLLNRICIMERGNLLDGQLAVFHTILPMLMIRSRCKDWWMPKENGCFLNGSIWFDSFVLRHINFLLIIKCWNSIHFYIFVQKDYI